MRTATAELIAYLSGNTVCNGGIWDLVTLTLAGGTVYRWTDFGQDVTTGGHTWTAGGTGTVPLIGRGKIRDAIGLEPSEMEITISCGTSAYLGSVALPVAAVVGALSGASLKLERCYMSTPGTVVGTLLRFDGQVADVAPSSTGFRMTVRSDIESLNQVLPKNIYRELCIHALYDAGCGVTEATFTTVGAVQAGSTASAVKLNILQATGYYNGGRMVFTSGALNGQERTIATYVNGGGVGTFTFTFPLDAAPATSDGANAIRGCNKTAVTCSDVFSNLNRRRGFDFVPPPEATSV
jgi:uncharacterized phage protein (TIGR02218 family)